MKLNQVKCSHSQGEMIIETKRKDSPFLCFPDKFKNAIEQEQVKPVC